jgi:PAS domain S-box-containing protein
MVEHDRRSVDRVEGRLEFETLIADLSSRFINLPPAEVDREIEDALRRVCQFLGFDYSVLWQWPATTPVDPQPTHAYLAQGRVLPPEPLHHVQFPWIRQELLAGRMVVIPSVDEMPAEAAVDRENARRLGIKSDLSFPLSLGGEPPIGALAFNDLESERDWPDALVKRLRLVAQVFTNALARRRHELSLRESEERLNLAADAAGAGLWTLDDGTGTFWATEKARNIFGYTPDEVISMGRFETSVHPDDWDLVRGAIERSVRAGESLAVEYRIIVPGNDRVRWIASRGRPTSMATGEPPRLMGVSIDVTERKLAEESHRASEARLAAGADIAGLAYYEVDFDRRVAWFDDRFRDLTGLPPDREQGLQPLEFWMEHLHPDDRHRLLDLRKQLYDGPLESVNHEYRYLHPAHGERWLHQNALVAARDATGHAIRSFGVLRDITVPKRIELARRDLSRRLIRAHEEERALLARELHDDLTQRLAVLAIEVGRAELAAPEGARAEALRSIREGLVRVSEDIHSLAYQLHPSVLDELGLAEALRAEVERLSNRSPVKLSLELDPLPPAVGKDAALCLFRVAQESLSNATRHSGAQAIGVTLRQVDGGVALAVHDDGVGFDPSSPARGRSLGLASMRERVLLVDGTLDISSAPGRGAEIVAWVPVKGEAG